MKKLAIIGGNGMLGSDLVKYLSPHFSATSINRENYSKYIDTKFDVVINANGNSRRYWANQNPKDDFFATTVSVYKSIFDFPCELYIYISSPDVYENHTGPKFTKENAEIDPKNLEPYGFHKYLGELIIKKYKKNFVIMRSSMILGSGLKKGPFYDIIRGNPLFITQKTRLQLITAHAISEIIEMLIESFAESETINVGGIGSFDFTEINNYFKKKLKISPKAEMQIYEMNVGKLRRLYPKLKNSEEYLRDFLKNN